MCARACRVRELECVHAFVRVHVYEMICVMNVLNYVQARRWGRKGRSIGRLEPRDDESAVFPEAVHAMQNPEGFVFVRRDGTGSRGGRGSRGARTKR